MTIMIPYSLNPALYGITFKGLGMPDKFAYAMDLTMRFIPTFGRDFQLTMDAQRARGYELEKISGGLIEQVRKMGPIFVPVIIHAIIGSEDIIDAMDLRAFGVGPRTWIDVLAAGYKRPHLDLVWCSDLDHIDCVRVYGIRKILGARSIDKQWQAVKSKRRNPMCRFLTLGVDSLFFGFIDA